MKPDARLTATQRAYRLGDGRRYDVKAITPGKQYQILRTAPSNASWTLHAHSCDAALTKLLSKNEYFGESHDKGYA